jgi:hypothetical protein
MYSNIRSATASMCSGVQMSGVSFGLPRPRFSVTGGGGAIVAAEVTGFLALGFFAAETGAFGGRTGPRFFAARVREGAEDFLGAGAFAFLTGLLGFFFSVTTKPQGPQIAAGPPEQTSIATHL